MEYNSKCLSCGKNFDFDSSFCSFCGKNLQILSKSDITYNYKLKRDQNLINGLTFLFQYFSIPLIFSGGFLLIFAVNSYPQSILSILGILSGIYLILVGLISIILVEPLEMRSNKGRRILLFMALATLPLAVINIYFLPLNIGILYYFNKTNVKIIFMKRIIPPGNLESSKEEDVKTIRDELSRKTIIRKF